MRSHLAPVIIFLFGAALLIAVLIIPDPTIQRNNKAISTCYPYQVKSTYVDGDKWIAVCATGNGVEVKEIAK